jgi:hypothetical protein
VLRGGAGIANARSRMRAMFATRRDAARAVKIATRISRGDSPKKPVLASGDETRSRLP